MTTRFPTRLPALLTLAVLLAFPLLAPRAARAGNVDVECYHAEDDGDGDGYAESGSKKVMKPVDENKKLYCPSGFVRKADDCDDNRAEVHPHAPEIAFNLLDDDCDEPHRYDEPELVYFPNGNQNTTTSFSIRVRLASLALVSKGTRLAYDVEYADLAATGLPAVTAKRGVGTLPSDFAFDAPVGGLAPARVYRARLRFYEASTPPPPPPVVLGGGRPPKVTPTYTYLNVASDWYFTATAGDGSMEAARTEILLEGFYQLSESDHGRVGYMGTVKRDGTRYGAAAKERWCTEFYSWLAGPHFLTLGASTVAGQIAWFASHFKWAPGPDAVVELAKRGDYVPIDAEGDGDTAGDHSMMFLAYDVTTGKIWTLEGNWGNYVLVKERPVDAHLKGVGRLPSAALID
jgi:hypothetical protein